MIRLRNNRQKCYIFPINPSSEQEKDWSGIREIIIKPDINEIKEGDYTILEPLIQNHLNSTINAVTLCNMEIEDATYKGLTTLCTELEKDLVELTALPPVFEIVE